MFLCCVCGDYILCSSSVFCFGSDSVCYIGSVYIHW